MTIEGRIPTHLFGRVGEVIKRKEEGVALRPGGGKVEVRIETGVTAELFRREGKQNLPYWLYDFRFKADDGKKPVKYPGALIIAPGGKRYRVPDAEHKEGEYFPVEGFGEWMWKRK